MRLKRFKPGNIRVRSSNAGSKRGSGGRRGFPGFGRSGGLRRYGRASGGRRGGKLGLGTIFIALIAMFIFGADPMQLLNGEGAMSSNSGGSGGADTFGGALGDAFGGQSGGQVGGQAGGQAGNQATGHLGGQGGNASEQEICNRGPYSLEACNALASLNQTWEPIFNQANTRFEQPFLDMFTGGRVDTEGCGSASSASGPFYCPADSGIYLDTNFFEVMEIELGAGGDFARLYVMAHEYGHHIQNLTGVAEKVRRAKAQNPRAANQMQVRMELQADCYAGVWAAKNRNLIEPGDMEEGMNAASAIGDDTLQRNAGQRVNPEGFTHGTSAQRKEWLGKGLKSGDPAQCNSFADMG